MLRYLGTLLMVSTWYGICVKACCFSLSRSRYRRQVSRLTVDPICANSVDPSERSKSHSTNDKPTQNEVNTPHYWAQRVYRSVGPGLAEVWAEATRRLPTALRFASINTKNSCTQPPHVFTTLYGYASLLARQVISCYSFKCPVCGLSN